MDEALESLLRDTSRSFYLTLRILPAAIRPQIGLAYLLARTTDTIADTEVLPVAERLAALQTLRARILGQGTEPLAWANLSARQSSPAEQRLLQKVEAALAVLKTFTARDLQDIRHVLVTITSGQDWTCNVLLRAAKIRSSLWKPPVNWMIIPIGWPAVSVNFGLISAAAISFPKPVWMTSNFSKTAFVLARDCNW
ncbi:MAG TPA: squalene/phytoene synthase family protein [Verrucomicrobiae bacterium]